MVYFALHVQCKQLLAAAVRSKKVPYGTSRPDGTRRFWWVWAPWGSTNAVRWWQHRQHLPKQHLEINPRLSAFNKLQPYIKSTPWRTREICEPLSTRARIILRISAINQHWNSIQGYVAPYSHTHLRVSSPITRFINESKF